MNIIKLPPGLGVESYPDGTPVPDDVVHRRAVLARRQHILYLMRRERKPVTIKFFCRSIGCSVKAFVRSAWSAALRAEIESGEVIEEECRRGARFRLANPPERKCYEKEKD